MAIREELAQFSPAWDTALTIGTFDGVHLGHQRLIQHLKAAAASHHLMAGVLTFRNHPRSVLNPAAQTGYISSLEERLSLLREAGIDLIIDVDFTRELSLMKAREFVSLLYEVARMRGLVVGPDFALGHQREGTIDVLKDLGSELGFWVDVVEPVTLDQGPIRSSAVRRAISQGDMASAGQLLGRPYSLTGLVVEGERRGNQLGFPTANLSLDSGVMVPGDGIYATWTVIDGMRHLSATNVGVRPTFGAGPRTVEAFIMDFDRDIYGKYLTLEFSLRLREELSFDTVDALIQQMKLDVEQARAVLSASSMSPARET